MNCPSKQEAHGATKGTSNAYNLELFVIAIYCFIEDELYRGFLSGQWKTPSGEAVRNLLLSDAECLTIEIVGHFLRLLQCQKKLYRTNAREHFLVLLIARFDKHRSRTLCAISANLWHVKACDATCMVVAYLQGHLAPCQHHSIRCPYRSCKLARRYTRKIFRTEPIC